MKYYLLISSLLIFFYDIHSATLHVGNGFPYTNISDAALDVKPGDTILIHAGVYPGGEFVADLQGTELNYIYILNAGDGQVIIRGGTSGWQLTDAAYLYILGLTFEQQTGNGFNLDDGGTYETPALHITFIGCTFRDMDASGNNDLLKLSGLVYFIIDNCLFVNGSEGGSGIDMVGCQLGQISNNIFVNMGSNAIQVKGGSQFITIEKNFFQNCGQRTLNLGGSTGLEFFRPINATSEASDINVFSNIIIGSVASVAYVGSVRVQVINNTIVEPEKWVLRILQETVDTDRFEPCGNNVFQNNLIYKNNAVSTDCNIGPDTAPETFLLSNNLWFNSQNPSGSTPIGLPVPDNNNIVGEDPLIADVDGGDFSMPLNSPAVGTGFTLVYPVTDYIGNPFLNSRSIGAIEEGQASSTTSAIDFNSDIDIFPNPATDKVTINWKDESIRQCNLDIINASGKIISSSVIGNFELQDLKDLKPGNYFFILKSGAKITGLKKVIIHSN